MRMFSNPDAIKNAIFFRGLFSYDLISNVEQLSDIQRVNQCPDLCFY